MNGKQVFRIFIGYDSREQDAYDVCVKSLLKHSSIPLSIQPLDEIRLRHAGLYTRNWQYKDGQFVDNIDRKPFSTSFSFTRFLVPSLCQWKGIALYCDCDFLWRSDVEFLLRLSLVNNNTAVSVVKHDHNPNTVTKMEGQKQTKYYRKNWSSLIIYNCSHPSNLMLTPKVVSEATGQWLHSFSWLHDHEINEIDKSWNCLSGIDKIDDPLAVHFTNGTPSMKGHENDPYADEWRSVLKSVLKSHR
jgi:lipopolysaccharide biosynthesis glycosyltransferase